MSRERKTYKVFISSTYLDNAERRKLVEDAVIRAEMQPVGMERFTASVHPTVEECERQARECDIYVGIIAHRYGWIPEGKAVSITEIEYDAAKSAQRPSLMFQIDKSVLIDMERDFDEMPGRWAKQKKLDAFKGKVRQGPNACRTIHRYHSGRKGVARTNPVARRTRRQETRDRWRQD
ncbi:MAG: DUF4062 domain-containing protein [Gammaproteobacteria bacterium]